MNKTLYEYQSEPIQRHPQLDADFQAIEIQAMIVANMIQRRHELKMTQKQLAELCNMPQASLARIETGTVSPSLNSLLKIITKLGLRLSVSSNGSQVNRIVGNILLYPAVFSRDEIDPDVFKVTFPDLPGAITEGKGLKEAMLMAIECAGMWLVDEMDTNGTLPEATDIENVVHSPTDRVYPMLIDLDEARKLK